MAKNGKNASDPNHESNGFLGRLRIQRDMPQLGAPTPFEKKIRWIRRTLNLVLLLALGLLVSVLLVPIEDVYTAEGLVRPRNIIYLYAADDLEQRVRPLEAEGDRVSKDQILMRFHLPRHEKEILEARDQQGSYEADLAVQRAKTASLEKLPLPKELWEINQQLAKSVFNRDYYKSQLTRAEELVQSGDISAQEVEGARLQYEQASIEHERLNQRLDIVDAGYTDTLIEQARAEEARIVKKIESVTARLVLLQEEFERLSVLRAPADGIVLEMPYKNVIGVIKAGQELAYMGIGKDRVIEIFGLQENFDKVEINQSVRYKSKVYDAMKVDYAEGKVFKISQIRRVDVGGTAADARERYYSILATIDKQPKPLTLDSNVTAQIILDKHRVFSILFGAAN